MQNRKKLFFVNESDTKKTFKEKMENALENEYSNNLDTTVVEIGFLTRETVDLDEVLISGLRCKVNTEKSKLFDESMAELEELINEKISLFLNDKKPLSKSEFSAKAKSEFPEEYVDLNDEFDEGSTTFANKTAILKLRSELKKYGFLESAKVQSGTYVSYKLSVPTYKDLLNFSLFMESL